MAKIELTGGHIGFNVLVEITKINWIYAYYRDYQDKINWRPY